MSRYQDPPTPGQDLLVNQIHHISHAFYDMPPEMVVDLFTDQDRETERDVVHIGTRFWLETTFKKQVLCIDFDRFTQEQIALLRVLASLINGETASQTIIEILRDANWFQTAFANLFAEVAKDMFNIYFCYDNQQIV